MNGESFALSSITEYKLCYVTNLCLQLCTLTMDTFVHLFSCLINLSHLKMKLLQIDEKRQEGYVYDINSEKPTKCRIKQMDIDTVSQSALEYLLYYIHSTLEELIIDKFNQDLFQQFLPYNKLTQLKITNGIDTGCICSIPLLNLQYLTINLTESNCDHISETISKLLDTYSNLIHLTILVELDVILNHLHIKS
ncbi:unnamed protein product [Didymodactylos carnosus]|uniref:Uncharacterized protein n=1 Tax=Didymodactylos carnosus TaxID=1234261 RepID=A0A815X1T9_9BILA|nr:unnamed protein product [Didymodactylos carnosus]CAF4411896.1 unnamed protein product [Didymodactylos carnosus]